MYAHVHIHKHTAVIFLGNLKSEVVFGCLLRNIRGVYAATFSPVLPTRVFPKHLRRAIYNKYNTVYSIQYNTISILLLLFYLTKSIRCVLQFLIKINLEKVNILIMININPFTNTTIIS